MRLLGFCVSWQQRILVCLRSPEAVWKVGLIKLPGLGVTHILYTLKRKREIKHQSNRLCQKHIQEHWCNIRAVRGMFKTGNIHTAVRCPKLQAAVLHLVCLAELRPCGTFFLQHVFIKKPEVGEFKASPKCFPVALQFQCLLWWSIVIQWSKAGNEVGKLYDGWCCLTLETRRYLMIGFNTKTWPFQSLKKAK